MDREHGLKFDVEKKAVFGNHENNSGNDFPDGRDEILSLGIYPLRRILSRIFTNIDGTQRGNGRECD